MVKSAGKDPIGAKRVKRSNWCKAREKTQLVQSAGKDPTGPKRGKTFTGAKLEKASFSYLLGAVLTYIMVCVFVMIFVG